MTFDEFAKCLCFKDLGFYYLFEGSMRINPDLEVSIRAVAPPRAHYYADDDPHDDVMAHARDVWDVLCREFSEEGS